MGLFGRRKTEVVNAHTPLRAAGSGGPNDRAKSFRKQSELHKVLGRQLAICAARGETGEFDVVEIGFVIQVHTNHNGSYAEWRAHWERRFQSVPHRNLSTGGWAPEVPEGGFSVLLLPVKPGTTSVAASLPPRTAIKGVAGSSTGRKRNLLPQLIGVPMVGHVKKLPAPGGPEVMGMDLVCGWLEWAVPDGAPKLAPPVFEYVRANGREVLKREIVTWEMPWPLSAPPLPDRTQQAI